MTQANHQTKPEDLLTFTPANRRIRLQFGGQTIADSTAVMLLREPRRALTYYFPQADVRMELLAKGSTPTGSVSGEAFYWSPPSRSKAQFWALTVDQKTAEEAAWSYADILSNDLDLRGYVAFNWPKMDHWLEEEEEVFGHPRDPYHRVDVLQSSHHIKIVIGGQVVAETKRPRLLLETSLPPRYYIPQEDIRMDLLTPTESHTICPYKGTASYWSLTSESGVEEDIVWSYLNPLIDCSKIENLLSFYDERVEAVYVDGILQEKPKTMWSK